MVIFVALGGSIDQLRARRFVLRDGRRSDYRVLGGSCKTTSAMNKGRSVSASMGGAGPPCRCVSMPLFESDSPGAADLRTDDKSIGSRLFCGCTCTDSVDLRLEGGWC